MASTKSFKDLPKSAAAPSVDDLKKQLAAAEAALQSAGASAPAKPDTVKNTDAEPVVIEDDAPASGGQLSNPADFMALMTGDSGGDTMAALTAALETDGGGGGGLTFPTLTQVGGQQGGPFSAIETKNADLNAVALPEGKRPFLAVFVAYRYLATIWPEAKNDGGRPIAQAAIASKDGVNAALLMRAGKGFQFSKKDARNAFAVSAGGPGIPKPSLEFLLFSPDSGELFVYRTPGHYNSAKDARDQLLACANQQSDGSMKLIPFLGEFAPETVRKERPNLDPIVHHYPRISKIDLADVRTGKAATAYKAWLAKAGPDLQQRVTGWLNGDDMPVNSQVVKRLTDAENLGA